MILLILIQRFVDERDDSFGMATTTAVHPLNGRSVLADMLHQAPYRRAQSAATRDADLRGVSYEIYGFMNNDGGTSANHFYYGKNVFAGGLKKSDKNVQNYVHKNTPFGLKGQRISASQIWIIMDGDRGGPGGINNYPDKNDDHGAQGGNALSCDSTVQWLKGE